VGNHLLAEQEIPYRWEDSESLVAGHPELTVLGGGRFCLDLRPKTLRVWDASSVYGRFDASALSEQLAAADSPWKGLTISVA
jgi:hypothetical protein